MNVDKVNSSNREIYNQQVNSAAKADSPAAAASSGNSSSAIKASGDVLILSPQAKSKFGAIKSKVNSGYYNKEDVIRQTAQKIAERIDNKSQA